MINIDQLKFDEKGLIPAVVVDAFSKKVLTVAYMNRESLKISMKKGLTCFYSRSRNELWLKGETSGTKTLNILKERVKKNDLKFSGFEVLWERNEGDEEGNC